VVITAIPTATITYAGTPFCTTLTTGQAVTLTGTAGYTGGTYSGTAGLTIDATTGVIIPNTSTQGNHTITYTIPAAAGCAQVTATTTIIVSNALAANITYAGSPFCTSLTAGQAVTLTGTSSFTGGTFSSTTGLTVDSTSGAITPSTSTPGNYVVTYTFPSTAGCTSVPATTNVVITAIPTATITYAGTPFCTTLTTGQAVTLTGTAGYTGGTYSGTAGLTIDATTGVITPSTSTPGNHTITYTIPAAAGCAPVTTTTTIVVTKVPTAAITYSGTPFCTSLTTGQAVTLTGTDAFTGGTYSSTTGLTVNATTGAIIPSTSTAGNYVVTYTVPASAGCASVPTTTNVVITAIPTATITYAGTPFCTTLTTGQAVTLTGTAGYTGGTYSGTAGLTIDATTGAITPSTSTPGNHTITYTIAAVAGCASVTTTTTIVVTKVPTAAITYSGTPFCTSLTTGQAVTLTGTDAFTGGTYSSTAGLTVDATTGAIIPSTSTAGNYVVTYTAPASAGCASVPTTTNVVITAIPTATITYAGTPFCTTLTTGQAITLTGTAGYTGGTYSGTAGLTVDATTGAITPSTSTPGNHTITYTIAAAAGCASVTTTTTIVVTKVPTAAITYSGTPFCTSLSTGQAVTLTGTDAYTGGTYSSTAGLIVDATTGAIIPSTSTAGNYVVTYTAPASAGCASVPTTTNVVITAIPTATITYAGTPFCTTLTTGQAVTLTGTAGYIGGTYSGTAGLIIDATTGAITPSTSTPGNHTITYTIPAAGGCAPVTATTTVIVNPIPIATATPSTVTICSLDTTNIALTSNAIGTTYAWTSASTNVTGASSATGNSISDALTATGNTPGTVVYTITPSGSGCTGLPILATVTVNPLPTATISGTSSICYNATSLISFTGTPNATVSYTINGGPNQTILLDNLGVGSVSTGNLTTTTTYQLVSVQSSGIPSCTQTQSGSVVVTVIPVPLVNSVVSSPTICSGQPTGISLSSNVTSATYNWTVTQSGVSGAIAGNGSIISQVVTTTGGVPGTVTYSIMANVGTCQGPVTPITITVNPIPVVTPSTVFQSICSGSVSPIQLSSNVVGTVFNWNVVQTNVTGASNGTGNTISQVLTTTSNNVGEAVYSVIPTVGGCPGLPILVTVRVNPIPVATANAAVTTICSSSSTNIALTSSVAGTTFSWTVIQTGIFGASSSTGNLIDQVLTTVGNTPGSVVYTITPTINGCSGAPITVTIIVNPTPEVFGSSTSTICSGETPNISLFPSIAATTFAWTVNANNVTGAQAGTGVVINDILTASPNLGTATYTVIPTANGCSGKPLTLVITVNPAPAPQINDGVICVDQATSISYKNYILDTNLSNATYDFAWYFNGVIINGATNNTYEATQAGTYSVIVTNTATGCRSIVTNAVVTASFPGTSVSTTETLAFSDNAIITVDVTGGNASFLYSLDNGPIQSSNVFTDVSPGSHIVTVTDANGCTNLTKLVSIIGYPTYFTPNGDSYHDTWNIVGLGATAKVFIFDRYGKLIKQISPTGEGWDGTLNGEPLMSTDYWFTVDYTEPLTGESKVFRSHFSLKR
jgi:gliding motility-associated-like protein